MRRANALIFIFPLILLASPAHCDTPPGRGLFVSVIQNPPTLSSRPAIKELIEFSNKAGVRDLFVQVYRANQAWFPSVYADSGPYRSAVKNVGEDPFALLIREAHQSGIKVHAWINLLSLSTNRAAPILKKFGPDILTRNRVRKRALEDYKIDSQYFLEPGDARVQDELEKIVIEIIRNYPDLDGIQFDYIRYPDVKPAYGYSEANIARFKKETGAVKVEESNPLWKQWKRDQVTLYLKRLVKTVRSIRPKILVSTTGCMPYVRAYHEAFQDWPFWLDAGIVDFVTLMGYTANPNEYAKWNDSAKSKTKKHENLKFGVGAYKLVHSVDVFENEFMQCEKISQGNCVVFHYGSIIDSPGLGRVLIHSAVPGANGPTLPR